MRADSRCLYRRASSARPAKRRTPKAGNGVHTADTTSCAASRTRSRRSSCRGRSRSSNRNTAANESRRGPRLAVRNAVSSNSSNGRNAKDVLDAAGGAAAVARGSTPLRPPPPHPRPHAPRPPPVSRAPMATGRKDGADFEGGGGEEAVRAAVGAESRRAELQTSGTGCVPVSTCFGRLSRICRAVHSAKPSQRTQ